MTVKEIIKSAEAKALAHAPIDNIQYWIMFAALLETELIIMEITHYPMSRGLSDTRRESPLTSPPTKVG